MGRRLDNATRLYLEAIQHGKPAEAIERYSGARYTQHSTPVRDGKEGFVEFFEDFLRRNPTRDIQIVRGFEDGPLVFLHVVQILNDGESRWVTADIFETDDDARMIEHWDIIEELVDETVSGHSQVGGPTEPTDLDKTEENKALVAAFVGEVLREGRYDEITEYVSDRRHVQHNPDLGDGVDALVEFARREAMVYLEVHRVIGCGSLVATLCRVQLGGAEYAVIDLFRIEDGRIVEHWDVIEAIQPREVWVNTGKF